MKHFDRSLLLVMACLAASLTAGACRSGGGGGDDDDDLGDGDADSDADGDSDTDSDSDSDSDADGDADSCAGEDNDAACSDQQDNNNNQFTDCTDFCCTRNITVNACTQDATIQDVRNAVVEEGTVVRLQNMIVTAIDGDASWYMQAASGNPDYSGIFAFVPDSNPDSITIPSVGDIITAVGQTDEYYGLTELSYIHEPTVDSTGNDLPDPVGVTPDEVGDEDGSAGDRAEPLESVLVVVEGWVTNLSPTAGANDNDPTNEFAIGATNGGPDLLRVDDHTFLLDTPSVGDHVRITGNIRYGHDHFKLEPRSALDLEML